MSKTSLQDRVRRATERDGLIPPGARVVAAVSGGPDSVALLLLLRDLAAEGRFTLAGAAHLNHGLRAGESDGDEAFCRALAESLGLPIEVGRRDVAGLAHAWRVSVEVAARRTRYAFFEAAAERLGADLVATGHTRDDQAETLLLRLLRGAGPAGLAGIRPRRGHVVRPLLDIRRDELIALLDRRGQAYRSDSTNLDVRIPRNWVRHQLLPMLRQHLGSDVTDVLAREAAVLRDEGALLDTLTDEAFTRAATRRTGRRVALDAKALDALPAALARRVVRRALGELGSGLFHGFDHVEQVRALAEPGPAGPAPADRAGRPGPRRATRSADLPGVHVERIGAEVVLYNRGERALRSGKGFRYELPVPGRVDVPECGCVIQAQLRRWTSAQTPVAKAVSSTGDMAVIAAKVADGGLAVRSRRPGDAFRPFGMAGRKKLQDVLVDRKVPKDQRDAIPLVVDADDRILWVGGHVVAEDGRVGSRTRRVVVLSVSPTGEQEDKA